VIKKGDRVFIRPEWQDDGDQHHTIVAADDEEKGRVTIEFVTSKLFINPTQVVRVEWLVPKFSVVIYKGQYAISRDNGEIVQSEIRLIESANLILEDFLKCEL
jgi:hypothetical protein